MANKIEIVINALDQASSVLSKVGKSMTSLGQKAKNASKVASIAFAALAAGIGAAGLSMIKAASDFQQTSIALTTMLGSTEKAQVLLKQLADFARNTPFTLTGIEESTKKLLAYGIASEDVMGDMKTLGDIAAGVGTDKLPQLILAFGQVGAATRLRGQELRQFTEAGVPLLEELGKTLGRSAAEIQDMTSRGQISFDLVRQALENMTKAGGRFFDLMDKQSKTVGGLWSNLQDAVELFLRAQGLAFVDWVSDVLRVLIKFTDSTLPNFISLVKETASNVGDWSKAIGIVAGLVIGTLSPAIIALTAWIGGLVAILAPFAVGGAIIGGIIAGTDAFEGMGTAVLEFFKTASAVAVNFPEIWGLAVATIKELVTGFFTDFSFFQSFLSNARNVAGALIVGFSVAVLELGSVIGKASSVIWVPMIEAVTVLSDKIRFAFEFMAEDVKEKVVGAAVWIADKLNVLLPKSFEFDTSALTTKLDEIKKEVIKPAKTFKEGWEEGGRVVLEMFSSIQENVSRIKNAFKFVGEEFSKTGDVIANNPLIAQFLANVNALIDTTENRLSELGEVAEDVGGKIGVTGKKSVGVSKATAEEVAGIFGDLKVLTSDFGNFWASELNKNIERLRDAGVAEIDIEKFVAEQRKQLVIDTNNAIIETSSSSMEILRAMWQNHLFEVGNTAKQVADIALSAVDAFSSGVGDAFASVITEGKSLGEALGDAFRSVIGTIISSLVEMGIQRLITSVLFQTANATESISRMSTLAAQTYAGAFAATASIPVVGPALAPGAATAALGEMLAGATAAGTAGAALGGVLGVAHAGLENVPEDSTFLLKKGERILSPSQNKDLEKFLSQGGGGVVIRQLNIMPNAQIDEALMNKPVSWWVRAVKKNILPAMNELGNRNATTSLRYKKNSI